MNLIVLINMMIVIGVLGIMLKNNFLMFFISLEIWLLAINFKFIQASMVMGDTKGVLVAMIIIVLGAVDTTVGLSLLLNYYNITLDTDLKISSLNNLKG
jgi:NADH-quinone oxidoreductase subunit K